MGKRWDVAALVGMPCVIVAALILAAAVQPAPTKAGSETPARRALKPPADGKINVAFVLTEDATMIDFAGPWEVFQDVMLDGPEMDHDKMMPFRLYTVSEDKKPIHVSAGMTIVPDFTFDDAPAPHVVVVPAQMGASLRMMAWLRRMSRQSDVLMSVCTGAFKLARAGLLEGKPATTHHDFYDRFEQQFPSVRLLRGRRFVQSDDVIATAGGLTSGIDLALHVVERYFGRAIAEKTATYMEYSGAGWKE